MRYRSKRRYRKRSYRKRRYTTHSKISRGRIARIVRKELAKNSEATMTTATYGFACNNPYAMVFWRPIDLPMSQGDRRYISQAQSATFGYPGADTAYLTNEVTYPIVTGNKLLRKKTAIKLLITPRLVYTNSLGTAQWTIENSWDWGANVGTSAASIYGQLAARLELWLVKSPKGRTDADMLTYLNNFGCSADNATWNTQNNNFILPVDRTKVTILKKKVINITGQKAITVKFKSRRCKGKYILPTNSDGALEATRPYNGKIFIYGMLGGTNVIWDTSPTPDRKYMLACNMTMSIYNTYSDL